MNSRSDPALREGRTTTITERALRGLVEQAPGLHMEWPDDWSEPRIYRVAALAAAEAAPLDVERGGWWHHGTCSNEHDEGGNCLDDQGSIIGWREPVEYAALRSPDTEYPEPMGVARDPELVAFIDDLPE